MDNIYAKEMEKDIREYIEYDIKREEWTENRIALENYLNDELFCSGVTGNDSGSYYFNREQSKETVLKNMDLLEEALAEFGVESKTVDEKFIREDWEYFDVLIRCSVLPQYIESVLDKLEKDGYFDEEL